MMGPACEPRTHQAGVGCLQVVDDDQSSGLRGQLLGEVLSPCPAAVQGTEFVWPVPVSRLHMTVKDQGTSGCPGHDPRGQVVRLIFASIGGAGGGHIAGK